MKPELLKLALDVGNGRMQDRNVSVGAPLPAAVKKINGRALSYSERFRGSWYKPEYDFAEIQIAQDTDSYLFKAIQKKVHRFMIAGWELVGKNPETVDYVKKRLSEIELLTGNPLEMLLIQTVHDLARYSNCMWVKVRNEDASSGKARKHPGGRLLEPVAGYFILPFETLIFKTKTNGEIKKIMQRMPTGESREFFPTDVVHFYSNKKPGFAAGTPEILPVLDDIALLRRLEENIEDLFQQHLFPLLHYKVGKEGEPERFGPDGIKETDVVKQTIEYMPAGGIYVSDHRHEITSIGAEGRALRAEGYLEYFKKRVFAGLGVSGVDMGEGDTANRSTAQTLSKSAIQDVEALQHYIKLFVEHFVFSELLLEGDWGMNAFLPENRVEIKFGTVDKEAKSKEENQTIQLWLNKLITESEARKRLGEVPLHEEDRENNYFTLYEEPLAMMKSLGLAAADSALAESATSSISPEGVSRQEQERKSVAAAKANGRPPNSSSVGAQRASSSTSRPSNQHGTRPAPKFSTDELVESNNEIFSSLLEEAYYKGFNSVPEGTLLEKNPSELEDLYVKYVKTLNSLIEQVNAKASELDEFDIKRETVVDNLRWRFDSLRENFLENARVLGVNHAKLDL